ncbi:MAG: hypothetical protein IID44_31530 [Planctomycetes bacterium]|nr:hypothetical protein [Planctomycetota bacterium]
MALPAAETAPTAAKAPPDVIRAWQKVEKDVVRAWEEAGATAGWMGEGEYGHLQYGFSYKPAELQGLLPLELKRVLPAFEFHRWKDGVLSTLPVPKTPFGLQFPEFLRFRRPNVTDAGLKQLAAMKSLRFLSLDSYAVTDAGLKELARSKSLQSLELSCPKVTEAGLKDLVNWNYGNIIHNANQILGRSALREGKLADAKTYLLKGGATPGSPQLNSFGPQMQLARELLEKGEKEPVLQYLDLVSKFWASDKEQSELSKQHAALIAGWKREIAEGKIPTGAQWR